MRSILLIFIISFFMLSLEPALADELKIKPYSLENVQQESGRSVIDVPSLNTGSGVSSKEVDVPGVSEGGFVGEGNYLYEEQPEFDLPEVEECNFENWIGKPVNKKELEELGRPWRVLGPMDQVTMEYMFGRINLIVENNIVVSVTCG